MPHDRNHPVRSILDGAAFTGHEPHPSELDALDLPPGTRGELLALIRKGTRAAAVLKASGENARARTAAREWAEIIVARIGDHPPAPPDVPTDPEGLAGLVPRY